MRFRKSVSKGKYSIREANLEDSEFLSELELDYLDTYKTFKMPRSPDKFRIAIGSGLVNNEKILVIENKVGEFLGYIEQHRTHPYYARLSYPYVQIYHPERDLIQRDILKYTLDLMKQSNIKYVSLDFSDNITGARELFESVGFSESKSIYQAWEGIIEPLDDVDIDPYEIRPVSPDDLDITYNWIKYQLDNKSPLYVNRSNYAAMFMAPSPFKDNWAIATYDGRPIALVAAMVDPQNGAVTIFGPYNDESYIDVRIPLLNELFVYLRMQGYEQANILRIREFFNDRELFSKFGFDKIEDIVYMTKRL